MSHGDSEFQRMILEWSLKQKGDGATSEEREKLSNLRKHFDHLETVGAESFAIAIDLPTFAYIQSIPNNSESTQKTIEKLLKVQYQIMRIWKTPEMEKIRPDLRALKETVAQMIQTQNLILIEERRASANVREQRVVDDESRIIPEKLYGVPETAKILDRSPATLYFWNAQKPPTLMFEKDGTGRVSYRGSSIIEFMGGKNREKQKEEVAGIKQKRKRERAEEKRSKKVSLNRSTREDIRKMRGA